jgi:hypothetical protein
MVGLSILKTGQDNNPVKPGRPGKTCDPVFWPGQLRIGFNNNGKKQFMGWKNLLE